MDSRTHKVTVWWGNEYSFEVDPETYYLSGSEVVTLLDCLLPGDDADRRKRLPSVVQILPGVPPPGDPRNPRYEQLGLSPF